MRCLPLTGVLDGANLASWNRITPRTVLIECKPDIGCAGKLISSDGALNRSRFNPHIVWRFMCETACESGDGHLVLELCVSLPPALLLLIFNHQRAGTFASQKVSINQLHLSAWTGVDRHARLARGDAISEVWPASQRGWPNARAQRFAVYDWHSPAISWDR